MAFLRLLTLMAACSSPPGPADPPPGEVEDACLEEGGGFPGMTADDLALEQELCEREGWTACDASAFIEVDAAICIAHRDGLEDGLRGLDPVLLAYWRYETVVWQIDNWEYNQGDHFGGSTVVIHATTGAVLDRGEWEIWVE